MYNWSTLKKLIWLYAAKLKGGAQAIIETITGNLPLVLQNAIQHSIKSLTRYGLCTQDGTPTPDAPVDIMCNNGALKWDSVNQRVYADGTPEVLTVSGANLLNPATNITGKYISANGSISNGDDAQYTDLIPVKAGKKYACSLISGRDSGNNRWHAYDANGGWVKQLAYVSATGQQGAKLSMSVKIDSGISYVRLSYGITDTEAMIEKGATATDYQPYVPPQTASVPMLLSVGDYKDEAELISGAVTHKVGVKVLDGTEAWTLNGTMRYVLTISDMATLPGRMEGLCTHFGYAGSGANEGTYFLTSSRRLFFHTKFETVDDLKAFLAAQYAAGTPVIVVYPLAEETTEQTTPQHLVTNEGTNIVDSVANVGPLEANVKYMAASAQDVLSKLLGMKVTKNDISTQDAEEMIDIITGEENK